MIKLIAFDLDDTLLNTDKEISIIDREAIKKATNQGIKIVFASGRPFGMKIAEYYRDLGISGEVYYVAYNGTAIYDVGNNRCLYSSPLDHEDIKKIWMKFYHYDVAMYVHTSHAVYTTKINEYVEIEKVNNIKIEVCDILEIASAHKFMLAGDPEEIKKIYQEIDPKLMEDYSVSISMPCFMEIFQKSCNKYVGIVKVAKMYGINKDEIMAFGDSMNDYEMVKNAHIGIAMGNANLKVQAVSKFVTSSNDQYGVMRALEKFVLSEEKK